jgi:predicted membrane-bound dolichyl-phosphate-mannose-protein mannosyltransferase
VFGLAAVTKRSASAAFSSLTVKAETSEFAEWLI